MQPLWRNESGEEAEVDDDRPQEDDVAEADQAELNTFLADSEEDEVAEEEAYQEHTEAARVDSAEDAPLRRVRVRFEHDGKAEDGELSIQVGDIIWVLDDSTEGWWTGRKEEDGTEGMFPENYTEPIED